MLESIVESWNLSTGLFRYGFISMIIAGGVLPVLGLLLILRKMPFLCLAIPAVAGTGSALTHFLWPLLFAKLASSSIPSNGAQMAVAFLCMLLLFTWISRQSAGQKLDHQVALTFLCAIAASDLLLLESQFEELESDWLQQGRALTLDYDGMLRIAAVCIVSMGVFWPLRREIWLSTLDAAQAKLIGISQGAWLYFTLLLVGVPCAVLVLDLGELSVIALLLIPAILLRSQGLCIDQLILHCSGLGLISVLLSFYLSVSCDWPLGPSLVLSLMSVGGCYRLLAYLYRVART